MQPNISEFSYGYALTEELSHWHGIKLTAAPVFPSLYQEGQVGGGWDVKLNKPGIPLFLQFKLSDLMVRGTAKECRDGLFLTPFYRMHIRPSRYSAQHEMLLDLENDGKEVYYTAPAFLEPFELNEAYLNHLVKERSIWVRPSWIGYLADGGNHHVAFQHPGDRHFCSNPYQIKESLDFDNFARNVEAAFKERSTSEMTERGLYETAEMIADISRKRTDISTRDFETTRQEVQSRHPVERIAFYSYMFLDAQMFIVNETETGN